MDRQHFPQNFHFQNLKQQHSLSIRKEHHDRIKNQKRSQQLLKINNPIAYLSIIHKAIRQKQIDICKLRDSIYFLSQNIKNCQFARILEQQKIIEQLLKKAIQFGLQTNFFQSLFYSNQQNYQKAKCIYSKKCQCIDCIQSSTRISYCFNGSNALQDIQIDRSCSEPINSNCLENKMQEIIIMQMIDFLQKTYYFYTYFDNQEPYDLDKFSQKFKFRSFRKFKGLFLQIPQILQTFVVNLISNKNNIFESQYFMENYISTLLNNLWKIKSALIFRLLNLLVKISQICYFDCNQWYLIFSFHERYFQNIIHQSVNKNNTILLTKNLFTLVGKSPYFQQIFSDLRNYKNYNNFHKLLYPCFQRINQDTKKISHSTQLQPQSQEIYQLFGYEGLLNFFVHVLDELVFIEKNLSREVKQILGQLLNISKRLEQNLYNKNGQSQFIYLNNNYSQRKEEKIFNRSKYFCQKIAEILYLQIQLSHEQLNSLIGFQPAVRQKIQTLIDFDGN